MEKLKVGVSTCLLGENVRYDGGHKRDHFICDVLAPFVEFVPVCPERDCGMPVPREALRLVGEVEKPRLMTNKTNVDKTEMMEHWMTGKLDELESEELCGYIFKSKSPSSGMERVKVYNAKGIPVKKGIGVFARGFMERFPQLPVEEEGRLHDALLRENFIERIFVYKRWRDMVKEGSKAAFVEFHAAHKYLIMSHNQTATSRLGRIVASLNASNLIEVQADYFDVLMEVLKRKPTIKRHCNVLMHIMGYFKEELTHDEKEELLEVIEEFRSGLIPLIVPVTLLNHLVRKYNKTYLKHQVYLKPHPSELKLRNHV